MNNAIVCFTTVKPNNLPKLHMCQGGFEKITLVSKAPGCNKYISFDKLYQSQIDKVPAGTLAYSGDAIKKSEDGITEGFYIIDLKVMMQEAYDLDKEAEDAYKNAMI